MKDRVRIGSKVRVTVQRRVRGDSHKESFVLTVTHRALAVNRTIYRGIDREGRLHFFDSKDHIEDMFNVNLEKILE